MICRRLTVAALMSAVRSQAKHAQSEGAQEVGGLVRQEGWVPRGLKGWGH
jgi:hypothetical protein